MRRLRNDQSGSGMLYVMITISLAIIVAAELSTVMTTGMRAVQISRQHNVLESVRQYLRVAIDCRETLASVATPCAEGTPLAIKRRNQSVIITIPQGSAASKYGDYYLRAYCTRGDDIRIEKSLDQQRWGDLFHVPISCP